MLGESSHHAGTVRRIIAITLERNVAFFSVTVDEELIDEFHCDERRRWRSGCKAEEELGREDLVAKM
jgi:hypothetical protein